MEHPHRNELLVFVVNTEPDFLTTMRMLLEDEGYAACTMRLIDDPFPEIVRTEPDLLMIDFPYREEAAWQLLDRLGTHPATCAIPVIASSTDPENLVGIPTRAGNRRTAAVVLKPLDLDHLLALVRSMLAVV